MIDSAREFLMRMLSHGIDDATLVEQVGLAAHELMENALKYSLDCEVRLEVDVHRHGEVKLVVENHGIPEHVAQLCAELSDLRQVANPLAHFREKMKEAVSREDGAGLGLARIRYEAEMTLDCEITPDGTVRVIARRDAPPP